MTSLLQSIDDAVFHFLNHTLANPVLDKIVKLAADREFMAALVGLIIFVLLWKGGPRERLVAVLLIGCLAFTDLTVHYVLKPIFQRLRPCQIMILKHAPEGHGGSYSFPSGHAANTFGIAVLLSCYYRRLLKPTVIFATFIAISRIYVGKHYLTDIVAGAVYGTAVATLFLWLTRRWRDLPSSDFILSLGKRPPGGAVQPLADEFVTVLESPDPKTIYYCSPGVAVLESGRIVATAGLRGPGMEGDARGHGIVFTSDDRGKTWDRRTDFPFTHARPFVAGGSVYVLGQMDDLTIMRSDDDGETWSEPVTLTDGERWHASATNVLYAKGCVYLVMEKRAHMDCKAWGPSVLAPVLLRGTIGEDLTKRESWTFASVLAFRDAVPTEALDYFGVPFYETPPKAAYTPAPGRGCAPIGWLETNVVQIVDPDHYWYDPDGRTFHLLMRAHTGGTGYAAVAKVVEGKDGSMTTMLETMPSGKKAAYVPCPGGQMRFHILYDETDKLYWLLSTQATDSMTRAERLDAERYNLPNNERQRLQLHFSRNCIDWCFAGIVAMGPSQKQSRHYAGMAIAGDDLLVLSRSGDARAKSAHDGNLVTFHLVKGFRKLVY